MADTLARRDLIRKDIFILIDLNLHFKASFSRLERKIILYNKKYIVEPIKDFCVICMFDKVDNEHRQKFLIEQVLSFNLF